MVEAATATAATSANWDTKINCNFDMHWRHRIGKTNPTTNNDNVWLMFLLCIDWHLFNAIQSFWAPQRAIHTITTTTNITTAIAIVTQQDKYILQTATYKPSRRRTTTKQNLWQSGRKRKKKWATKRMRMRMKIEWNQLLEPKLLEMFSHANWIHRT